MHRETEAPRLLPAHHRPGLLHLWADVLEANRHLVDLDAKLAAEAVDHRGHVHRLHDRLAEPADFQQIPHEERVKGQRRDEVPFLIGEARTGSVPPNGQTDIRALRRGPPHGLLPAPPGPAWGSRARSR